MYVYVQDCYRTCVSCVTCHGNSCSSVLWKPERSNYSHRYPTPHYFNLFYSTMLLCYALNYSIVVYSTSFHPTLSLFSTLFHCVLFYVIISYFILLHLTITYLIILHYSLPNYTNSIPFHWPLTTCSFSSSDWIGIISKERTVWVRTVRRGPDHYW